MPSTSSTSRFPATVLEAVRKSLVVGLKAGSRPHRALPIWAVVAEGRVFVRSWGLREDGWLSVFAQDPQGTLEVGGKSHRIRAVRTRSERLKDAVDAAYREQYPTAGSARYVRDLCGAASRATTTELVPRTAETRG